MGFSTRGRSHLKGLYSSGRISSLGTAHPRDSMASLSSSPSLSLAGIEFVPGSSAALEAGEAVDGTGAPVAAQLH